MTVVAEKRIAFELDEEQSKKARAWLDDHHEKNHKGSYDGAIGGRYTFSFTGTSIGEVAKVRCACGAECDVSDYDRW